MRTLPAARRRTPPGTCLHGRIGHRVDELGRDLGAVLLGQQRLDLAHCHAPDVYGDDLVVEPGEVPLVLGDQDRSEAKLASAVAWDVDPQWPSSVRTVLAPLPCAAWPRCTGARHQLGSPGDDRARRRGARSIRAVLNAEEASCTASAVIGPLTNGQSGHRRWSGAHGLRLGSS
ncbi:protein of unknown function (plasmid) [Cupriavidus taiwanensis]|nr:protein of unknown function [Cupriavidus taiwanensis]